MSRGIPAEAIVVVPSLKVSGGIREALRLAADLERGGLPAKVLSMWSSPHPMECPVGASKLSDWAPRVARAAFELPVLQWRFARWLRAREAGKPALIFTHYATFPLAMLTPKAGRYFFVQDLEWNFLGNGWLSSLLRRIVLTAYRSGKLIPANTYLAEQLCAEGFEVAFEAPIWADPQFANDAILPRDFDVAMVLRKGAHKRLDLYRRFTAMARERGLRVIALTPEDEIAALVATEVDELLLRPNTAEMKTAYARSKCFLHLSEHEGFGLPPLEAMGSGCVPVCRDSGGVRAFMRADGLQENLLPLDMPVEAILERTLSVIGDAQGWARLSQLARLRFDAGLRGVVEARQVLAARIKA